ncbi:hypothetical protein ACC712_38340, partial [Rhizobium ruizarguesonis]
GAIGIALIDTIIYTLSEPLGQALWTRLQTGDIEDEAQDGADEKVPIAEIAKIDDRQVSAQRSPDEEASRCKADR